MAVQAWHWGKLLIVWLWGILVAAGMVTAALLLSTDSYVIGFSLLLGALAISIGLTVITWCWLSGKEL